MAVLKELTAAWIGLLHGPDPIKSMCHLFVFGSAMDRENKNLVVRSQERYSKAMQVNIFLQVYKQNSGVILYAY